MASDYSGKRTHTKGTVTTNEAPYQKSTHTQSQSAKWYKGDSPTSYEIYGRIGDVYQTDPVKASQIYSDFRTLQGTPGSKYFNPHTKATNQAVQGLIDYGIDVTGIESDDWFAKNSWLQQYYNVSDTTNKATKPGKNASDLEWAAYYYNLAYDQHETTKNAINETSAVQQQVQWMVNDPSRNWSDQEIIDTINGEMNGGRYSTLGKVEEGKRRGEPVRLNTALDYSEDALKGMIWAARNQKADGTYGTGSLETDIIMSALGEGNQYKANEEMRIKLDPTNEETFSPYEVGPAGDDARELLLYFGAYKLDQDLLDENRWMLNGTEEQRTNYLKAANIVEYSQRLDDTLKVMNDTIDYLVNSNKSADKIIEMIYDQEYTARGSEIDSYKDLFALDDSIKKGKAKNTGWAIDYKRSEIEKEIREKCAARDKATEETDDEVFGSESGFVKHRQDNLKENGETLENHGTEGEKDVAKGGAYGADGIKGADNQKQVAPYEEYIKNKSQKLLDNYSLELYRNGRRTALYNYLTEENQSYAQKVIDLDVTGKYNDMLNAFGGTAEELDTAIDKFGNPAALNAVRQKWDAYEFGRTVDYVHSDNVYNATRVNFKGMDAETAEIAAQCVQAINYFMENPNGNLTEEQQMQAVYEPYMTLMGCVEGDIEKYDVEDYTDEDLQNVYRLLKAEVDNTFNDGTADNVTNTGYVTGYLETKDQGKEYNDLIADNEKNMADVQAKLDNVTRMSNNVGNWIDLYERDGSTYDSTYLNNVSNVYEIANTWVPTEWSAYSVYDMMEDEYAKSGGSSGKPRSEVIPYATYAAYNNPLAVDELKRTVKFLEQQGFSFTKDQYENLNRYYDTMNREARLANYYLLDDKVDFKKTAETGMKNASSKEAKWLATGEDIQDLGDVFVALGDEIKGGLGIQYTKDMFYSALTEKDKLRYFYLLETEGEAAAHAYFEDLTDPENGILLKRIHENIEHNTMEYASQNGWTALLSTAGSLLTKIPAGAIEFVYRKRMEAEGKTINPYAAAYMNTVVTNGLRTGSKEGFYKELCNGINKAATIMFPKEYGSTSAEIMAYLTKDDRLREVSDFLYDMLVSGAADSAINGLITTAGFGLIAKMIPAGSAIAQAIAYVEGGGLGTVGSGLLKVGSDFLHAAPMGIAAMESAYREAILKGAKPEQAEQMALNTFFAETLSEAITFGNMKELMAAGEEEVVHTLKDVVKSLAKNAGEEAFGEGFNEYWEQNADRIIMKELSEFERNKQSYIDAGYPPTVAEEMAYKAMWKEVLKSAASGAMSSVVSGGGSYYVGNVKNTQLGRSVWNKGYNTTNGILALGLETDTNSDTYRLAKELREPFSQGDKVDNRKLGQLTRGLLTSSDENVQETARAMLGYGGSISAMNFAKGAKQAQQNQQQTQQTQEQANPAWVDMASELTLLLEAQSDTTDSGMAVMNISAVLDGVEGRSGLTAFEAMAAAQTVVTNMAKGDTFVAGQAVQYVLTMSENANQAKSDIAFAAMTDGAAHSVLEGIITDIKNNGHTNIDSEYVQMLREAVESDQNGEQGKQMTRAFAENVIQNRIDNRVNEKLSTDDIRKRIENEDAKVASSRESAELANKAVRDTQAEVDTLSANLKAIATGDVATDGNIRKISQNIRNQKKAALNDLRQKEMAAERANKVAESTQKAVAEEKERIMNQLREEATAEVHQEAMQELEEREEAARIQAAQDVIRQQQQADQDLTDSIRSNETEDIVEEFAGDRTEEEKQRVRDKTAEVYSEMDQEAAAQQEANPTQQTEEQLSSDEIIRRGKLLNQIAKKFGIKIMSVDSRTMMKMGGHVGNGFYDSNTNTLVLHNDITFGEAMRKILGHELLHLAEKSQMYNQIATILLQMEYGADIGTYEDLVARLDSGEETGTVAADIKAYRKTYDTELQEKHSNEYILQELIADKMGDLLDNNGNYEMIERLAAEEPGTLRRIIESIKNFLSKLKGVKDPSIEDIRKTVDMMEKALRQAQWNQRNERQQKIRNSLDIKNGYQNAVNRGDVKTQQAYVDQSAEEHGFTTENAYHGTNDAGFTVVDMDKSQGQIFVAYGKDTAGTYSINKNVKPITDMSYDTMSPEAIIDLAKQIAEEQGTGREITYDPETQLFEVTDEDDPRPYDMTREEMIEEFQDYEEEVREEDENADPFDISRIGGSQALDMNKSGLYRFYTRPGKQYVVDAQGAVWDDITVPWSATPVKTREIGDWAKKNGYDSVRINNVKDFGSESFGDTADHPAGDIGIFFNQEDVKSADPVTRDNEGNLIMPEERFSDSDDLRYSLNKNVELGEDVEPLALDDNGYPMAIELQGGTVEAINVKYSLHSFNGSERDAVRQALYNATDENGKKRFTKEEVDKYIQDAMGIAAKIAGDRLRLDFEVTDPEKSMWKSNSDYGGSIDASTLCAKRMVYQGTFDAIQHALPDTPLMPKDLIHISNVMREMGYETPCGLCYVESRRKNLDNYIYEWLKTYKGDYIPRIDELSTTDKLEDIRKNHPKTYEDFMKAMNKHGQQNNPKVVQLRTEYKGEIRDMTDAQVQKAINNGGIRLQSFSDFETPHLLDMVQVVMDIASKNMTSQAYTKVPNFAWVFGDTGIKINLSLIGKGTGLDENGNLVFDNVEGMNFDEAMRLRDRYSQNVGTILVGINDDHIRAAMADPRIDYIIPFHRSGWTKSDRKLMHTISEYKDYTMSQNEKDASTGKKVSDGNIAPVGEKTERGDGYWDFNKTGKENAEAYLEICKKLGRIPKFSQFLVKNQDGSYSLQPDGSTDGYWKLLIDFKMYDNDGVGAPQQAVTPNINMNQAYHVLKNYKLERKQPGENTAPATMKDNNSLPVAQPVVDRIKAEYMPAQERYKKEADRRIAEREQEMMQAIDQKNANGKPLTAEEEAFMARMNPNYEPKSQSPVMDQSAESHEEEFERTQSAAKAIDPETGEAIERKWSMPVKDKKTLDFLNKQEQENKVTKTYRTMKLLDGKLVSPKATYVNGELGEGAKLGEWEMATEDSKGLVRKVGTSKSPKYLPYFDSDGNPIDPDADAYYLLDEKGRKTPARYNPYMHSSNLMLNDQFSGAYEYSGDNKTLGKFVTVECLVPNSEIKSGYHAQHAKDPVGWTNWKSGGVAQAAEQQGKEPRRVFLSRWIKPVRIVPDSEVAKHYKNHLAGTDIEIPANVVTPSLLNELEKAGVKIAPPSAQTKAKFERTTGRKFSFTPKDATYMAAVERGDMVEAKRINDQTATENGYVKAAAHGTLNGGFTEFDKAKAGIGGNSGAGFYFSSNPDDASSNYKDVEGADNWFKANNLADKILDEFRESDDEDFEYEGYKITEGMPYKDVVEIAKKILTKNPQMYSVYLDQRRPYIRDFNKSTNLLEDAINGFDERDYDRNDYDSDEDYEDDMHVRRGEAIYQAISDAVYEAVGDLENNYEIYGDINAERIIGKLAEIAMDYDELQWNDLIKVLEDEYIEIGTDEMDEPAEGSHEFARAIVEGFGYGSIEDREVSKKFNQLKNMGATGDTVHYIMFHPDQIKLADTVTYDDQGNIIPPSERYNKNKNDIRYALPSDKLLKNQIREYIENQNQNPDQPVQQPTGPQRQFGHTTAQKSDELADVTKRYLYEHSDYTPDTNRDQINRAINWIQRGRTSEDTDGYQTAIQKVTAKRFNSQTPDGQARTIAALAMAAAKNDVTAQITIADAYLKEGTTAGQTLQARKIFRLMTPEGRVATLRKMLLDEQSRLNARGIDIDLTFSEYLYRAAAVASKPGEFQRVRKAAAEELGQQLPSNWREKLRSIRMLSMLANPRTHIRNIVGNALFIPAVGLKNKLGAVIEAARLDKGSRTKTIKALLSKDIREFARQDALRMQDTLTGESKFNEQTLIAMNKPIFRGAFKWLQKLSDFNSNALEKEDWMFLKGHYRRALGGWMQANGYTVADMENNSELLETGRKYAIEEAQKATYRDFNKLAQTLNEISRKGGAVGFVVDAALPFKKTPANILRRGIEYSPIGIAKSLTYDMIQLHRYNKALKEGIEPTERSKTPNQVIDDLCSGLSGTAVAAIGFLLSGVGAVSLGLSDDDDEFEKMRGAQKYAINPGKVVNNLFGAELLGEDVTYTIDWAAPMSMPFFVGAAIRQQMEEAEGFNADKAVDALLSISDPVFNLSMLDGVNSLFKTSQQDDTNSITQIGVKILTNYATSYVPSFLSATTRTFFDDTRRMSYLKSGEGNGPLGTARYSFEQMENKIPGLSTTNIPYRDVWGNAETSSFGERLIENFISPGYVQNRHEDIVVDELERLYDATKATSVIPKMPGKTITLGKDVTDNPREIKLTDQEWDTYRVARGETAHEMLQEMMQNDYYLNSDESEQVKLISEVWEYANIVGKKAVAPDYNPKKDYGADPIATIVADRKKANKSNKTKDLNKELLKAVDARDATAFDAMVEALHENGVEDQTIKDTIATKYRPLYQEAYLKNTQEGDERMFEIEEILSQTGFNYSFKDWRKQADKKQVEQEEKK